MTRSQSELSCRDRAGTSSEWYAVPTISGPLRRRRGRGAAAERLVICMQGRRGQAPWRADPGGIPRGCTPPPLAWAVAGRYGARSDGDQLVDRESTLNDGVGRRGSLVSPRWPHSCCRLALVVLEGGRRLVAQRRVAAAPVVQPNDIAPTVPAFPRSVRLSTLGILGLGGSSESIT